MKIGRMILIHREDLVQMMKEYYLDGGRTEFLVISYNKDTVDPKKFTEEENFRLLPYFKEGERKGTNNILGQQFKAWLNVVKAFPEITHWVVHDYDIVSKIHDTKIFNLVNNDQFAMIGRPFPIWRDGMKDVGVSTFPFPQKHDVWYSTVDDPYVAPLLNIISNVLMDSYPLYFQNIKTLYGGYSDFIATSRENLLLLDDPRVKNIEVGGNEQIPFTIFTSKGIKAIDLSRHFKVKLSWNNTYNHLNESYDFLHPVKYWPKGLQPTLKIKIKNVLKKLLSPVRGNKTVTS